MCADGMLKCSYCVKAGNGIREETIVPFRGFFLPDFFSSIKHPTAYFHLTESSRNSVHCAKKGYYSVGPLSHSPVIREFA